MELKGRLKLIAEKIPKCNSICDIGTDHAYLPIYLVEKEVCKKAIAADVKKGPILAAKNNISIYKLDNFIETRLGNGLEPIEYEEVNIIIIAGMGGILIRDILKRDIEKARKAKALVLQPMNAPEILREWLYDNEFEIYDEEMTNEGEKIYDVISARFSGIKQKVDAFNNYVGLKLIEKKDPLLKKYIERWTKQLKKAIIEMEDSDDKVDKIREKYLWLIDNMNNTLEIIKKK